MTALTDPSLLPLGDLPTARVLIAHLRAMAEQRGVCLDTALRRPPPEPTSCCGRGCNGCVWEGFYEALHHWRVDALDTLAALPEPDPDLRKTAPDAAQAP
jgi:hypothetical protein